MGTFVKVGNDFSVRPNREFTSGQFSVKRTPDGGVMVFNDTDSIYALTKKRGKSQVSWCVVMQSEGMDIKVLQGKCGAKRSEVDKALEDAIGTVWEG